MRPTTATIVLLMALTFLFLLLLILLCRPWRFFSSSTFLSASSRRASAVSSSDEVDDVSRPLFSDNTDSSPGQSYNLAGNIDEESRIPIDGDTIRPRTHGLVGKTKVQTTDANIFQDDSLVLDMTAGIYEDLPVGHTLRHSVISNRLAEDLKFPKKHSTSDAKITNDNGRRYDFTFKDNMLTRSILNLEVVGGPSCGLCCSRQSSKNNILPLTIGRVSPCDFVLKDSEVSGKHAVIKWNFKSSKWELIDMGSLNGTFVNSQTIGHPNSGSRCWSKPFELADGDMIKLGTTSMIFVKISYNSEQVPAGVGIASDPMANRRGGKKLPMEDVFFCQWPLCGVEQFGIFAIFDGHGGVGAAKAACKMLPDNVINILSQPERAATVFSLCDASDVLRDAFNRTEDAMNHQYEGCTATVLLIWFDYDGEFFAQCANVGDSACLISLNGKLIQMTEDHRVTSPCERARLMKIGKPLKDSETRLCGLNLSRMLGDKFLKEQDDRFSSEPYISQVVPVEKTCTAFALMASDGLWDVISLKKAAQLARQSKGQYNSYTETSAEMTANYVLNEARSLRTKDNTSVIFLDFDVLRTDKSFVKLA